MGRHAKGHHQAQESLGRSTGAADQFRGIHHALHVFFILFSLSLSLSLGLPFLLTKGFGFVADFDTREFSISALLLSLRGCGKRGSGSREKYLETSGIHDRVWVFIYSFSVGYSVCRIVSGYSFFLDSACTGQFSICVHRSLRKITHNSFMTDIGSRLRSTSIAWYVSRGTSLLPFPCFCVCRERWPFM